MRENANSVSAAAEYLGLPAERVQACLRYYADYQDEVDDWTDRMRAIAEREEAELAPPAGDPRLRSLLDEMYSPQIASRLRSRGHDVVSVTERTELAGRSDEELFASMAAEHRAIVTNNVATLVPLLQQAVTAGIDHAGLLLTSDRSLPRTKAAIGRYVTVLDELLVPHPDDDALRNQLRWLP